MNKDCDYDKQKISVHISDTDIPTVDEVMAVCFTLTYTRYGSDTTILCLDILSLLTTCVFQNNLQGTKIHQYMSPFMKVRKH
jgi:hypothetical protein